MANSENEEFPWLSQKEALILEMLVGSAHELYGLQMVDGSQGKLKRGTIYVALQRMEEKGLIESRTEARPDGENGIPRRLYKITGHGQRVLAAMKSAHAMVFAVS